MTRDVSVVFGALLIGFGNIEQKAWLTMERTKRRRFSELRRCELVTGALRIIVIWFLWHRIILWGLSFVRHIGDFEKKLVLGQVVVY
jgi:hypothetical protein